MKSSQINWSAIYISYFDCKTHGDFAQKGGPLHSLIQSEKTICRINRCMVELGKTRYYVDTNVKYVKYDIKIINYVQSLKYIYIICL